MKTSSLFAALMLALPLSGTAFAASFNCAKAGSANEKIICGDTELSALDDRLGKTFKAARAKAANRRAFMAESDKQWRWREDNCHERACLLSWYQRRETELLALADGSLESAVKVPAAAPAAAIKPAEPVKPVALAKPAPAAAANVTAPTMSDKATKDAGADVADAPATPPVAATPAPLPVPTPASVAPQATTAAKHIDIVTPPAVVKAEPAKVKPAPAAKAPPAPAPAPVPALASQAPVIAKAEPSLRSKIYALKLADMDPGNALPKPHYLHVNQGEYTYEDPRIDPASGKPGTIGVRYLGMENGQYIIEAAQREGILRYTCSADCRYINKLLLPGDIKRDTVVLDNDNVSVASLIVNDVINGLLAPSRPH